MSSSSRISSALSRSPSWGAWIEMVSSHSVIGIHPGRSPSWGAWIEIAQATVFPCSPVRRSPSWGAWIEISGDHSDLSPDQPRRSPSWGAWIEIYRHAERRISQIVAPPRGERGLKSKIPLPVRARRGVAPPRGERGLKWLPRPPYARHDVSLPLVGSVD